jgi:hypothetical protein
MFDDLLTTVVSPSRETEQKIKPTIPPTSEIEKEN